MIDSFEPEGWFVLEPVSPDVSIPAIIKEFGLITYRDYIKRAGEAQRKARK